MLLKTETAELSALARAWTVLRKKKLIKKIMTTLFILPFANSLYPPINIEILLSSPPTTQVTSAKYHKKRDKSLKR